MTTHRTDSLTLDTLDMTEARTTLLTQALQALAALQALVQSLPNAEWLQRACLWREAVASGRVDGSGATLVDLLRWQQEGRAALAVLPSHSVVEMAQHAAVLAQGLAAPAPGQALTPQGLCQLHGRLFQGISDKAPGQLRSARNTHSGTVGTRLGPLGWEPPAVAELPDRVAALCAALQPLPATGPGLLRIGLAQAQLTRIAPFWVGNTQTGRVLVSLLLAHSGLLTTLVLPLSRYAQQQGTRYFQHMHRLYLKDDGAGWLDFFLEGVAASAQETVQLAPRLQAQVAHDQQQVQTQAGRAAPSAQRLLEALRLQPLASLKHLREATGLSPTATSKALQTLVDVGIAREHPASVPRSRLVGYDAYLALLSA